MELNVKEGTYASYCEDGKSIRVKICDINDINGSIYCSLKDINDNYLLSKYDNKKRRWLLNIAVKRGLIVLDDKCLSELTREESELKNKISHYANYLKNHVCYFDKPLTFDSKQISAIVSDKNTLVRARAGSGKTRVIMGKILSLVELEHYNENNVMAFCFNKDAASEINTRISNNCLIDNQCKYINTQFARTFHSLAFNIVNPSKDNKILDNNKSKFLKRILNNLMENDKEFRSKVYQFFKYSLNYVERKHFITLDEYYKYKRNSCYRTLNGEKVKSRSEKIIADYLFEHGIEYVYEKSFFPYKIVPSFSYFLGKDEYKKFMKLIDGKKETKPDFYLKEYNYIWEHWAVSGNENNLQVKDFNESVGNYNEYIDNKNWKIKFWHNKNLRYLKDEGYNKSFSSIRGLIETSELEFNGSKREQIEEKIENKLKGVGIYKNKLPQNELEKKVWKNGIDGFTLLMEQFINKVEQYYFDDISLLLKKKEQIEDPFVMAFCDLGYQVYLEYTKHLHSQNKEKFLEEFKYYTRDFNELMYDAIRMVDEGKYDEVVKDIRWMLIDEFQDFSRLFDTLLNSIIKRNPLIKVFAVGDDWQAINRFAGSNITYFNKFLTDYEDSKIINVTNNYRSGKLIVETSNEFMKNNRYVLEPSIASSKEDGEVNYIDISSVYLNSESEIDKYIYHLFKDNSAIWDLSRYLKVCYKVINSNIEDSVLILNRSNNICGLELETFELYLKKLLKWSKGINDLNNIKVSTVHSSKGEEANKVILLDVNEKVFPVYNPNNHLFELFNQDVNDCVEDEIKLFYVGLTRAKNSLNIVYNNDNMSLFVEKTLKRKSNKKY